MSNTPKDTVTAKHTPGPWKNRYKSIIAIDDCDIAQTFQSNWNGLTNAENKANAALIAAAPELLAALKDMLASVLPIGSIALSEMYSTHLDQMTERIRASITNATVAIARAEGRQP